MKRIYVCNRFGCDTYSGNLPEPGVAPLEGPLRTLDAARSAIRRLKRGLTEPESIEVVLRGGCYRLGQTLTLTGADSGFGRAAKSHARIWPVIWRGEKGEDVTLSGGHAITGWQAATLNGQSVWFADVSWACTTSGFFRQLWIAGARRPRARLPKCGTFKVAAAPDAVYVGGHGQTVRRGASAFGYHEGDMAGDWTRVQDIDVQFRGLWMSPRARLLAIDVATRRAVLDRDTSLRLAYAPGDGLDYVLENVLEALTEPGEWALDAAVGRVWYRPLPDERPETVEAIAGGLDRLVDLRGACWLRFENIAFSHTEWRPDPTDAVADQSSSVATAAIHVGGGCEGIAFAGCRIEHVGGYGLECADGAADVVFQDGRIRDLGAGGVKIWHGCRRCVLDNCEIADGGHLWLSGAGVLIGKAGGNAVTRCHIHDFYYTAISVGWTWGYAEGDAYGNVIEWNHIHDIGKGLLSDMGGIYLLGQAMGTRVRHNRIHDIHSLRYGGWAIYPDEGSSDLLIENNLCYRTDREIFHQHYGRNNVVRNNVFAYGGEAVLAYSRMEEHTGLIFEKNIFVARGTPIVRGLSPERWRAARTRFNGNLYWCEDGPVWFDAGTIALATQPFRVAYADEADHFRPLPPNGTILTALSAPGTLEGAVTDVGHFSFGRQDGTLTITGRFKGAPLADSAPASVWTQSRIEVFLKPFSNHAAMAQFGVAANGDRAVVWYGCDAGETLEWTSQARIDADGWSATLAVPLDAIEKWIRATGAIAGRQPVDWRALAGVTLPPAPGDFAGWQIHTGETTGCVADPRFTDPEHDDFSLAPDSPALDLGFQPFEHP